MKVCDAIERVDEIRPNAFSEERKLEWISVLEGQIMADVLELPPEQLAEETFKYPDDMDRELLAKWPHDAMYVQLLMAKIDEANGEYDKYANSMEVFNAAYENFVHWFLVNRDKAWGGAGG